MCYELTKHVFIVLLSCMRSSVAWITFPLVSVSVSIVREGRSFPSNIAPSIVVSNREVLSGAWCFMPGRWPSSHPYLDRPRRQRSSLPVLPFELRLQFKELCSDLIIKLVYSKVGAKNYNFLHNGKTISLCCIISLPAFRHRSRQVSIRSMVPDSCCCRSIYLTWTAHASMSSVICSVAFDKARTGGDVDASISVFMSCTFLSEMDPNVDSWSMQSPFFNGAANRATFGTKRLEYSA